MSQERIEQEDYYLDEIGRMVFTEQYHLKRGYCCKNGCKHCPWKDHPCPPLKNDSKKPD
ncbi:MAG TPA: DUF5522 domain-containing protein [Chitinophagales bacterium]|nr:hypothetical protein [Chitinophagales bacterium]HPA36204.1 DUF5522 domain-containing protein [Chitinophagales bacterium]HQD12064.1 DUF5522 domain-containing protein [Chitinophagales bacterium]HQO30732.1 DUF5522 domain-containing protein [Chitinophagales bacterium]